MAKTYRIIFRIDDSQANAAAQRSVRSLQAIEASAKRAVAAQELGAKKLGAIQDQVIAKTQKAGQVAERSSQKINAAMALTGAGLVAGATAALKIHLEMWQKIRTDAEAAAAATLEYMKAIRVESTLKGLGQTTNQALRQSLTFRAKTGLGSSESSDFIRQFEGSLPIGLQKGNITRQVADQLSIQAGIRAARQGGDAGTHGDLAGVLGQFGKVGTAEEALGQLEAIRIALTEGRGDDTPLTQQLLKAAGAIVHEGGTIASLPEMAALIGVTSLSAGPQEAGTRAEQLVRGLRVGLTKQRTAEGTDVSQADYLKGLGITEKDDLEATLAKIIPDLRKAKTDGRDLDVYLAEKNFRNFEERRALVEVTENYDAFTQRMANARKAGQGAAVATQNQAFLTSPQGRNAIGEAAQDIAKHTLGVQGISAAARLKATEASPAIQEGDQSILTRWGDWFSGLDRSFTEPEAAGRQMRIENQAISTLSKQAFSLGVPEQTLMEKQGEMRLGNPHYARDYSNWLEQEITARGGNVGVDMKPVLERLTKVLEKMDGGGPGKAAPAPAPLPAAPRAGPVRP